MLIIKISVFIINQNMFRYIVNSQHRQAYKYLTFLGIIDPTNNQHSFDFDKLSYHLQTTVRTKEVSFLQQCFVALDFYNTHPQAMYKSLMFVHLVYRYFLQDTSEQMLQLYKQCVNKILDNSKKYCDRSKSTKQKKKDTHTIESRISATQYDLNEDQMDVGFAANILFSSNTKQEGQDKNQSRRSSANLLTTRQHMQEQAQISSNQQLLCVKLIQPYCSYLLKLVSNYKVTEQSNEQTLRIWKYINILKLLLRTTDCFQIFGRYYTQYSYIIVNIMKVIQTDINYMYSRVHQIVEAELEILVPGVVLKENNHIMNSNQGQNGLINETKKSSKLAKEELKQILKEIEEINQMLKWTYWGRYYCDVFLDHKIKIPKIFQIESQKYDQVFKEVEGVVRKQELKQLKIKKKPSSIQRLLDQLLNMKSANQEQHKKEKKML